jgi:hypothetical protein
VIKTRWLYLLLETQHVTENLMKPIEPSTETTTDLNAVARQLGMKLITALVPDESVQQTASGGAERTRRSRDKSAAAGIKQMSLAVPLEHHALLKVFAERTRAGEPAATVLTEMLRGLTTEAIPPAPVLPTLQIWRRWLIQRLLPAEWLRQLPIFQRKS